jgi:ectoine hydroxylase-related dioxygenase (phytanoyl-CoA dioxygenase family)
LCKAGDAYLFNHQLWHRGSTNRSDRRRYLMQNQYCRSWGPYRFNSPDAGRRLPADRMAGASERLMRLLEPTRTMPA